MNLRSSEEVFRYVMSEIWNEYMHLHDSLWPEIHISIGPPVGAFVLTLKWRDADGKEKQYQSGTNLTELCDKNCSMTSWLRTFIHESKIQEDCPVRKCYQEEARRQKVKGDSPIS